MERAVRVELTIPDLQSGALASWRRALAGTEGEVRTLESSLEDSHVSGYITSVRESGTPGRIRTRNLDVRSVALFQLSYRSKKIFGAPYRIRTGVSALATPCLGPTGPTMRMVGEDRVELSPRVPKTRMLALHHTPIRTGASGET